MNEDTPKVPERSLVVREPWATHIVEGRKRWEIRRYPTRVRGRIGIVSPRGLIGAVRLIDVLGPFAVEELLEHIDKHLATEEFLSAYAGTRPLYAWVLEEPEAFPEPLAVERPGGPRVWVHRRQVRLTTPP
ncbi:hypothetical protein HRbin26_00124 [bacterium HR26]|nr:hypothetical protein HRbin26_00124 [bacterium HR26]